MSVVEGNSRISQLEGVTAKLDRADEHRRELHSEIEAWVALKPISVRHEIDESAGQIVMYSDFDPMPDLNRWAVAIGDVVHNLRSALDHLAWQLVILNQTEDPDQRTAFPIFKIAHSWHDNSGERVRGMAESAVADIERLQPYHRGNNAEKTLLWILHELNRDDKHRLLVPVIVRAEKVRWEIDPEPQQIAFTPTMKHGAPFMYVDTDLAVEVKVKGQITGRVAINVTGGRHEVSTLLSQLRNEVAAVGNVFAKYFV